MNSQPKLVNKQFNSPIGLYSEQNIREVIQRESQILSNGAVGVNFNNTNVGKPTNLQNSAVLRMLEEEEQRQRHGQSASNGFSPKPLQDQKKWPPPDFENKQIHKTTFKDVVTPGVKRVAWPPPEGDEFVEQAPVQAQGGPQHSYQINNHAPVQQQRYPLKPLDISSTGTSSPSTFSPITNQSPAGFRSPTTNKQWAPVQSPVSTPNQPNFRQPTAQQNQFAPQQNQFAPQQYQSTPQQYSPSVQQYQTAPPSNQFSSQQFQQPPQQYQSQQSVTQPTKTVAAPNQVAPQQYRAQNSTPAKKVEPPPSTITLRPKAPVSQAPPPLVTSQPATATLKGGKHLRGDLKWPPEHVKKQMEEEKQYLLEIAKGPAHRPTVNRKDYTPFFEQHALNNAYPGYKIPPGTQFYEHNIHV